MTNTDRNNHPMISDITTHTIDQTVEAATQLWAALDLYPGKPKRAAKDIARIAAWAAGHQITQMRALTGAVAGAMLRDLVGVANLAQVTDPGKLDKLHRLRNTLIALRGTVLIADSALERKRSDRPGKDTLAADLPRIAARSRQRKRPLTDDEILLARILVEIDLREGAEPLPILAYLVTETGVRPMAATALTTTALDDRHQPTKVTAPGVWKFKTRKLKFEPFVARNMARALADLPAGTQRLTYTGSKPGDKAAAASLNPVITRYLVRAGIDSPEITMLSLNLWRPHHALTRKQNLDRARHYHGGKTKNLLNDLKCETDEQDIAEGVIHIVSQVTGKRLGTFPTHQVNDTY